MQETKCNEGCCSHYGLNKVKRFREIMVKVVKRIAWIILADLLKLPKRQGSLVQMLILVLFAHWA